eukprot:8380434-Pyramimonas_sp.AAC.1
MIANGVARSLGASDAESARERGMVPYRVKVVDGVNHLADGLVYVTVVVLLPKLGERALEELNAPLHLAHEP